MEVEDGVHIDEWMDEDEDDMIMCYAALVGRYLRSFVAVPMRAFLVLVV